MREIPHHLYSFDGKYLDLDGLRYHYLDEGNGEPVLAVHGNPTWSFYYRELVKALRTEYRVIVPDHIGCGLSDKPDDSGYDYTLSRRIEDLSALADELGLERVNLVVHDWGGAIGLGWAVRNPERVARIVILNTAAFHLMEGKALPWQLWVVRNTPIGALLVRGFNAFARGASRLAVTRRPLSREIRNAYCAPYGNWSDRIATLRFVQDVPLSGGDPAYAPLTEIQEGLRRFSNHPIMICWGARDFVFDDQFLDEWRGIYPHAEVHRFADAGHYVLEDAADEIITLVKDFLTDPRHSER
jgi:haloalkane dehalogenase